MVFPVVMYGCESWTIKKAEYNYVKFKNKIKLKKKKKRRKLSAEELMLLNCGVGEDSLDCKEIQPVHLKEISPGCSLEGLMLKPKLQYFGHLMQRTDSLENTLMLGKIEGRTGWG